MHEKGYYNGKTGKLYHYLLVLHYNNPFLHI